MLSHAHGHLVEQTDSSNRYAVLGFDQSVEGCIAAYLRYGPGTSDGSPLAAKAREVRSNFWAKVNFLEEKLRVGRHQPVALEEITRMHTIRNDLQHDGGWFVPSDRDAEESRRGACAVYQALADEDVSIKFGPVAERRQPALLKRIEPPDSAESPPSAASRRRVGPFLYEIARANDPGRDGLHVSRLESLAKEVGGSRYTRVSVASSLNNDHDLFERLAPAVYTWRQADGHDVFAGVSGKPLADVAYVWCQRHDPAQEGRHYNREIRSGLQNWGVLVRGPDVGRTIRQALSRDARFIGANGVFRWIG
jgi:hypothetical protein